MGIRVALRQRDFKWRSARISSIKSRLSPRKASVPIVTPHPPDDPGGRDHLQLHHVGAIPKKAALKRAALPIKSADVFHAPLLFDFSWRCRLSRKLKDCRFLSLGKVGQEYNSPIRKLQRIMVHPKHVFVDLPKDCRLVSECLLHRPYWAEGTSCHLLAKSQLGSW